jgi:serine protease Do
VSVSVVEYESVERAASGGGGRESTKPQPGVGALGLGVVDLSDAQRRELKIKGGVRVESVDGAAARAGIREGDVLLSVDNTEVTNAKQFDALMAKLDKSRPVTLLVRRGDSVNFLIVRPMR